MRYGIFGDIHSNLEAFQEVVRSYKEEDVDRYICIGDIVGYGADPHECIEELKKLNASTVCGNHDWAAAGVFPLDYFNLPARKAIEWTKAFLSSDEKEFLKKLELVIDEKDFSIVHGSLYQPDFFNYIVDGTSAYICFRRMEKDLCFVGHSHVPMVFWLEKDEVKYTFEKFVRIKSGIKYIINVGSIGQPRDNNPMAAYSIFDSSANTVEIKRIGYDIEKAKNKILKAGLPEILGYRLIEGR